MLNPRGSDRALRPQGRVLNLRIEMGKPTHRFGCVMRLPAKNESRIRDQHEVWFAGNMQVVERYGVGMG